MSRPLSDAEKHARSVEHLRELDMEIRRNRLMADAIAARKADLSPRIVFMCPECHQISGTATESWTGEAVKQRVKFSGCEHVVNAMSEYYAIILTRAGTWKTHDDFCIKVGDKEIDEAIQAFFDDEEKHGRKNIICSGQRFLGVD